MLLCSYVIQLSVITLFFIPGLPCVAVAAGVSVCQVYVCTPGLAPAFMAATSPRYVLNYFSTLEGYDFFVNYMISKKIYLSE